MKPGFIQRQQPALVLEQDHGLPGGLERQGFVFVGVGRGDGIFFLHEGVLEQPKLELHPQDLRDCRVNRFHGDPARLHRSFQVAKTAPELDIHAAGEGLLGGLCCIGGDEVQAVEIVHAPAV